MICLLMKGESEVLWCLGNFLKRDTDVRTTLGPIFIPQISKLGAKQKKLM